MADKIERCVCGHSAFVMATDCADTGQELYYVECMAWREEGEDTCWRGPEREEEGVAVEVWNRVMRAAKGGGDGDV